MVSDKSQVRATGTVNNLHRQPIKGRKRGGGVRFGEMERDSLLAHGTSFLLNDRLMRCSDYHQNLVCKHCGSIIAPAVIEEHKQPSAGVQTARAQQLAGWGVGEDAERNSKVGGGSGVVCLKCGTSDGVCTIAIPYVFMFLAHELAAMNIKLRLDVQDIETGAKEQQYNHHRHAL